MRAFALSVTAGLLLMLLSTVAWSAEQTELSKAAERLQKGMQVETVISILGEPDWAIVQSDSGKYALNQPPDTPEDKKAAFELLWKNNDCQPVSVYFTQYYKAVGWDRGLKCGPEVTKELPEQYSCEQSDRSRYCKQ